jgi:hypothetical protein
MSSEGIDRGLFDAVCHERDRLHEALQRIEQWAKAYPVTLFKPISDRDLQRADEVLRLAGISMTAMHGQWAHHLLDGIGKIAREGLDG